MHFIHDSFFSLVTSHIAFFHLFFLTPTQEKKQDIFSFFLRFSRARTLHTYPGLWYEGFRLPGRERERRERRERERKPVCTQSKREQKISGRFFVVAPAFYDGGGHFYACVLFSEVCSMQAGERNVLKHVRERKKTSLEKKEENPVRAGQIKSNSA